MIEVTTDRSRRLVIARMEGMLQVADVEAFGRREQEAVRAMGLRSGDFDLLVIAVGNLIQTQEVMNAFANLVTNSPLKSRKFAIVRDGVLTRMQTRRVSKMRQNVEIFDNLADAEVWLKKD